MSFLILGLILFLGVHSARVVGEAARQRVIAQRGEMAWKGLYTLVSLAGFALILYGYGHARQAPTVLWVPPVATRHIAALLMLLSFVLLAGAYIPRNAIKARLRHPMTLAVKVWALAHLLSNGNLADVVLFGSFLLWSVLVFRAARARDRQQAPASVASSALSTALAVGIGLAAWAAFAFWAHVRLIGVRPFGG